MSKPTRNLGKPKYAEAPANLQDNYRPDPEKAAGTWLADGRGCGGSAKRASAEYPAFIELPAGFAELVRERLGVLGMSGRDLGRRISAPDGAIKNILRTDDRRLARMDRRRYEALLRELGIRPEAPC